METPISNIPTHSFNMEENSGIFVTKITSETFDENVESGQAHRHNSHVLGLHLKGISLVELDFKQYQIKHPSVLYQSPNQVHRILNIDEIEMFLLVMEQELIDKNLYKYLQGIITPHPLLLRSDEMNILEQAFLLCANLHDKKEDKFYFHSLKNASNALIGLYLSFYLKSLQSQEQLSRFERIHYDFLKLLEVQFKVWKRPSDYAQKLNISVAYLNECVKTVTGFTVSYHIQQRVVLEAKRLLYYADKSVKEIANELGYDDYPYFSRLFSKVAGMTASTFKNKNHV